MLYRETSPNVFTPWYGEEINGYWHPLNIEQLWTDEELAKFQLYRPVLPEVPPGKYSTDARVERVNGVVTYILTLIDIPPPESP